MAIPFWYEEPDTWNTVVIGPYTLGPPLFVCKVPRFRVCFVINKNKASGRSGGRPISRNLDVNEFQIQVQFGTKEAFAKWEEIMNTLVPQKDPSKQAAYSIYHPVLALVKIDSVIVKNVSPGFLDDYGVFTAELLLVTSKQVRAKSFKPKKKPSTALQASIASQKEAFGKEVPTNKDRQPQPKDQNDW